MHPCRSITLLLSLGLVCVLAAIAPALAQVQECPSSFSGHGALPVGASLTCTCSSEQITGSVWGTGRYTGDSSVCAAARHAGVIRASGGKVTVYREGKCPALVGSIRNGIETRDWGAYDLTFAFEHPAPGCTPSEEVTGLPACPASMVGQEGRRTAEPLECSCSQRQITGSVWGSDLYTFDSSVCAAARHAGAVGSSGGEVLVFTAGRCASFKGTARNGVTSSDWGPFDRTFAFRYPLPGCADGGSIQRR